MINQASRVWESDWDPFSSLLEITPPPLLPNSDLFSFWSLAQSALAKHKQEKDLSHCTKTTSSCCHNSGVLRYYVIYSKVSSNALKTKGNVMLRRENREPVICLFVQETHVESRGGGASIISTFIYYRISFLSETRKQANKRRLYHQGELWRNHVTVSNQVSETNRICFQETVTLFF